MTIDAPVPQAPHWQVPRASRDNRVVGGVAAGIASELGVDPLVMRVAFVPLAAAGGWGVLLYGGAWLAMALASERDDRLAPTPKGTTGSTRLLGIGFVAFGLLLFFRQLGGFVDSLVWPIALAASGVAVAHQRGLDLRGTADRLARDQDRSAFLVRVAGGGLLVFAGIALAITLNFDLSNVRDTMLVAGVLIAGLAVVLGPWVIGLVNDLTEERRARIRSDERAAVAAHLHDSVLQTLSLIQRRADDAQVVSLARKQERELRSWLFGQGPASDGGSFRRTLEHESGAVEELHSVPVEVVVVGDAAIDEDLAAVLAATREAVTNAVVHSGSATVDVFAEIRADSVDVFVRDTGSGFDTTMVPDDRRGVADSIVGRLERLGGSVQVISTPGVGTEVEMHLDRRKQ